MERERKIKKYIIIGLFIAIVGLTLGFSAFENILTITPTAEVKPINSLKVYFSSSSSSVSTVGSNVDIQYLPSGETTNYPSFVATTPTINNSSQTSPTLTNLSATFIRPGESVQYTLYIHNQSTYDVQLTAIGFGTKSCSAKGGTNQTLVNSACSEIDVSVTVGGGTGEPTAVTRTQNTGGNTAVTNHILAAGAHETVTVTLSYADLSSGLGNVDLSGDFDVTFGNISLTYSSAVSGN